MIEARRLTAFDGTKSLDLDIVLGGLLLLRVAEIVKGTRCHKSLPESSNEGVWGHENHETEMWPFEIKKMAQVSACHNEGNIQYSFLR